MNQHSLRRATCPLLLGLLAGTFAAQSSASLFPGPFAQEIEHDAIAPVVTDINGDGLLDVVTVGRPALARQLGLGARPANAPEGPHAVIH